jgi:hypothetical protein
MVIDRLETYPTGIFACFRPSPSYAEILGTENQIRDEPEA